MLFLLVIFLFNYYTEILFDANFLSLIPLYSFIPNKAQIIQMNPFRKNIKNLSWCQDTNKKMGFYQTIGTK